MTEPIDTHTQSLGLKLYRSYLSVVSIGAAIFLAAVIVTISLRQNALSLAIESGPRAYTAIQIERDLNQAIGSLRGWVSLGDENLRKDYLRVWRDDIEPSLANLKALYQEDKQIEEMIKLEMTLKDLYEWQWYIAEIANTPGNRPALDLSVRYIEPIAESLLELSTSLIESEFKIRGSESRIKNLADIRFHLNNARTLLTRYLETGKSEYKFQFVEITDSLNSLLLSLVVQPESSQTPGHTPDLALLKKEFVGFRLLGLQAIDLRGKESWNLSRYWLTTHALPLVNQIKATLFVITDREKRQMALDEAAVVRTATTAIWILASLLVLMIVIGVVFARRLTDSLTSPILALVSASQRLANGELSENLKVTSTDEIGKLTDSFNIMRESIERQKQEISAREIMLRTTIETVVDPIISINTRGEIQSFNRAATKLFGYDPSEVINTNINRLMPSEFAYHHDEFLSNYLKTGKTNIIGAGREVSGLKKDGTIFPVFISVDVANLGDQIIFVGTIVDMTARKENEQQLISAKEQAEQSSRLKSEFLSLMSHELRTPLTVILGYLPILAQQDKQLSSNMVTEIAGEIKISGEHLLTLINDILDISKIEAGRLELKRQLQHCNEIVNECFSVLKQKARNKNISLINDVPDFQIYADPLRIKQVFINLIGNAIKFTEVGSIVVSCEESENLVRFEIRDTGCGIEASFLPLLFEKFYQIDSSSTRAASGTGLGLAITKRLVELHGGTIEVRSQIGEGSVFAFTIINKETPVDLNK